MTPRVLGESGALIWQLRSATAHPPAGANFLMNLRLMDERDQPVGLLEYEPIGEPDFNSTSGRRRAAQVHKRRFRPKSRAWARLRSKLRLTNQTRNDLYLTLLQLYGKPAFSRRSPLEVRAEDGEGMHIYGLKRLALDLPALSHTSRRRRHFADYELARRKHPRGSIQSLTIRRARSSAGGAIGEPLRAHSRQRVSDRARRARLFHHRRGTSCERRRHTPRGRLGPLEPAGFRAFCHHRQQRHRRSGRSNRTVLGFSAEKGV